MTVNSTTGDQDDSSSQKARFYTPDDVALHNCAEDCWLSLFGQVLDLTELILANRGPLADPLIAAAGTDVSHWFHLPPPPDVKKSKPRGIGGGDRSNNKALSTKTVKEGGDGNGRLEECENASEPRTFVDPQTGLTTPYLPMGSQPTRIPPNLGTACDSLTTVTLPHRIEKLTRKARPLRVVNILSRQEDQLLVACEDTIADIQDERFLGVGANSVLLHLQKFVPAKMDQTLEENGIVDDDLAFEKLGIDDDGYMPILHIYFNDDLTIA
ncbi:unnamed protein product [Ectocarpus sp. CCAP 1310/34]|nr:unnamed protein product [Ectocarpus sp. CCAP 1310/34]